MSPLGGGQGAARSPDGKAPAICSHRKADDSREKDTEQGLAVTPNPTVSLAT